jgi:hypothetical protein
MDFGGAECLGLAAKITCVRTCVEGGESVFEMMRQVDIVVHQKGNILCLRGF